MLVNYEIILPYYSVYVKDCRKKGRSEERPFQLVEKVKFLC